MTLVAGWRVIAVLNVKERLANIIISMKGKDGSPSKTRTCDKAVNSRLLYQLSYRGTVAFVSAYNKGDTDLPRGKMRFFKKVFATL